jgi:hypothetical protein
LPVKVKRRGSQVNKHTGSPTENRTHRRQSNNNSNYGVAVGAYATSDTKGPGTVAIGAYSKAERQNEIVSTATANVTNKAQTSVIKFRNRTVSNPNNAELFTDGSSGRLTLLANSVISYVIQVTAISSTDSNAFHAIGGIRRIGNSTTLMSTNPVRSRFNNNGWEIAITADDTNDALRITFTGTGTITFSATAWITETRL